MLYHQERQLQGFAYLVKHRTIGTDVSSLVVLLLADSRNTTRTKSGGASTDELSETTDKLELRPVRLDAHLLDEDVVSLLQVLEGVVLDVGEEGGVERVGLLQRADVGTLEELDLGLLVQVDEDQSGGVRSPARAVPSRTRRVFSASGPSPTERRRSSTRSAVSTSPSPSAFPKAADRPTRASPPRTGRPAGSRRDRST